MKRNDNIYMNSVSELLAVFFLFGTFVFLVAGPAATTHSSKDIAYSEIMNDKRNTAVKVVEYMLHIRE